MHFSKNSKSNFSNVHQKLQHFYTDLTKVSKNWTTVRINIKFCKKYIFVLSNQIFNRTLRYTLISTFFSQQQYRIGTVKKITNTP